MRTPSAPQADWTNLAAAAFHALDAAGSAPAGDDTSLKEYLPSPAPEDQEEAPAKKRRMRSASDVDIVMDVGGGKVKDIRLKKCVWKSFASLDSEEEEDGEEDDDEDEEEEAAMDQDVVEAGGGMKKATDDSPIPMSTILKLAKADSTAPFRRVVYFMRGPPGCGKSTASRLLLAHHLALQGTSWRPEATRAFTPISRSFILSTDDYFTEVSDTGQAEYKFNPKKLRENHPKNQKRCEVLMELGQTPLFIDNTNIALWEMREYMELAQRFKYDVRIIDPRELGEGALDPQVLNDRIGEGASGRASGKAIPFNALQRMVQNWEEVPGSRLGDDPAGLQAIKDAKAPWEKPPQPPKPLYAGLDTEARALAALGGFNLGPLFWEAGAGAADGRPPDVTLMDARLREENSWRLPDRLHVTVSFFGRDPSEAVLAKAKELEGSWHEVDITRLVFVRGGDLLCADVTLTGDRAAELKELAGDGWLPHITLLSKTPWVAKHSNDVLRAWASAKLAKSGISCHLPSGEIIMLDDSESDEEEEEEEEKDADAQDGADDVDDHELMASLRSAMGAPDSAEPLADDAPDSRRTCQETQSGDVADRKPQAEAAPGTSDGLAWSRQGLGAPEVLADVPILEGRYDLVSVPLDPPRSLGRCSFKMFFA